MRGNGSVATHARGTRLRPVAVTAIVTAALLTAAGALGAHDFWIVPNAFELAPGDALEIRGQTSSLFPISESAVATDRIADARIISTQGEEPLRDFSASGKSLMIRHRPTTVGQRVVAISLRSRTVRETPASFRRYMQLEGAPEAVERYEREGRLPPVGSKDSLTRRYAKYAKTFVEVGRGGPRAFERRAGHPLEFTPLRDPATLRAGDTLGVRLTMGGQPLAGAHVHAGAVQWPRDGALTDTAMARRNAAADVSLTTDDNGIVRLVVDRAGMWNVRGIHIVPAAQGSGADWDVHWATIVFRTAANSGAARAGARRGSDSSDVADAVRRYGAALAAGDSATVLELLAPDAVILESGGIETRAEYRNHHLPGDIAFARAVRSEDSAIRVVIDGQTAWASSTSTTQGEFRGRPINSVGAELMVLTRGPDGRWRIRAIHWSSRAKRPS